jgi:hypothetical protein
MSLMNTLTDYIAPDGLVRLDLNDRHPPFKEGLPDTVKNENGLTFRAELLHELRDAGFAINHFKEESLRAIELCSKSVGITHRRPAQEGMTNSHDNKVGELVLLQLHAELSLIKKARWALARRLWVYNNTSRWGFKEIVETFLLPRDQALYRMACGHFVGVVSFVWLWFSVYTKSKERRLFRLRMASIKMSHAFHKSLSSRLLYAHYKKHWDKWGGLARYAKELESYYMDHEHPIKKLLTPRL